MTRLYPLGVSVGNSGANGRAARSGTPFAQATDQHPGDERDEQQLDDGSAGLLEAVVADGDADPRVRGAGDGGEGAERPGDDAGADDRHAEQHERQAEGEPEVALETPFEP